MAKFAILFESPDEILSMTSWTKIMTSHTYFKILYFKRPGVAIFAEIIKIVTMIIKTIIRDSGKVKIIRNYVSKYDLYLYFLLSKVY